MDFHFKEGTHVIDHEGKRVGNVRRVVLDPKTKTVSHLVVEKGFLFKKDKVVPVNLVEEANNDRIRLIEYEGGLDDLPDFEELEYIVLDEHELFRTNYSKDAVTPMYSYPAMGPRGEWGGGYIATLPPEYPRKGIVREREEQIPANSVALKEGAKIVSEDDKHLGELKEVLTSENKDGKQIATSFVMSSGLVQKGEKRIPIEWIKHISEGRVVLGVGASMIKDLPAYSEE